MKYGDAVKYTMLAGMLSVVATGVASASSLVFEPKNNAIFADAPPGAREAMLASVDRPSDKNAASSVPGQLSPGYVIQQSVLGQVTAQINDEIFNGTDAAGSFPLGNGSNISYTRTVSDLIITFTDPVNGVTTITLPNTSR